MFARRGPSIQEALGLSLSGRDEDALFPDTLLPTVKRQALHLGQQGINTARVQTICDAINQPEIPRELLFGVGILQLATTKRAAILYVAPNAKTRRKANETIDDVYRHAGIKRNEYKVRKTRMSDPNNIILTTASLKLSKATLLSRHLVTIASRPLDQLEQLSRIFEEMTEQLDFSPKGITAAGTIPFGPIVPILKKTR